MTEADKCRRAAEMIINGDEDYSCMALSRVGVSWEVGFRYKDIFREGKQIHSWSLWWGACSPENQKARANALLLMAEITEGGGL